MTTEKHILTGESSDSPIPPQYAAELAKTGLRIHVFYQGITSAPRQRRRVPRRFPYYSLSQLIAGDGYLWEEKSDSETSFGVGSGVLAGPDFSHLYGGNHHPYTEDSICFSGPAADALKRAGIISSGIWYFGEERRLLPVIRCLRNPTLPSLFEAHARLLTLLLELGMANRRPERGDIRQRLLLLQQELQKSPRSWTVEEMAEYCNISANCLRRRFREETGMSPKEYVDRLRLNRAMELLTADSRNIGEIARLLGFSDEYYFYRRFKELSGVTPGHYRRLYGRRDHS